MTEHLPGHFPSAESEGKQPHTANRAPAHTEYSARIGSAATLYFEQSTSPKNAEVVLEHTPESFLRALRADIQDNHLKKRSYGRGPYSSSLAEYLHFNLLTNELYASEVIKANDITSFAYCVDRFITRTNHPSLLSREFVDEIYYLYKHDVEALNDMGVKKPALLALSKMPEPVSTESAQSTRSKSYVRKAVAEYARKFRDSIEPRVRQETGYDIEWSDTVAKTLGAKADCEERTRKIIEIAQYLQARFPNVSHKRIDSWAMATLNPTCGYNKSIAPSILELLEPTPTVTYDESKIPKATEELMRLRQVRLEGNGYKQGGTLSPASLRFADIAQANWHDAFTHIDAAEEAQFLWAAVSVHNQKNKHDTLTLTTDNVYHMLIVFARDVEAIKKQSNMQPVRVARFYGPDVYKHYAEKYPDVPNYCLKSIVAQRTSSADTAVQHFRSQVKMLTDTLGEKLPPRWLTKWATSPDALDIGRRFIKFKDKAESSYPWIASTEIVDAFAQANPKEYLVQWDRKLKDITRLYPDHKDLSPYRRKVLASYEGEPATIVEDYFARVDKIMGDYGELPVVKRSYALQWAESRKKYIAKAEAHIACAQEIDTLLQSQGLFVEQKHIGTIAYRSSNPEDATNRFLINRKMLEDFRDEAPHALTDHIENWMINHIASLDSSPRYSTSKLIFLANLQMRGAFDRHLDRKPKKGLALGDKIVGTLNAEGGNSDEEHLVELLSLLNPLDRQAVMMVFGFNDGDKQQLQKQLDVENLEDYVFTEVVPHLSQLGKTH